jgi:hypothetical protein
MGSGGGGPCGSSGAGGGFGFAGAVFFLDGMLKDLESEYDEEIGRHVINATCGPCNSL